jgi:stringent starvation protein B
MAERSTKPYLIRAIHEWCADSSLTPYISVQVDANTRVPAEYVKNGEIVLNLSYDATHKLTIGNEVIQFAARFNGVSRECSVPISAVTGIFARENGRGMFFPREAAPENAGETPSEPAPTNGNGGKPKLQIIK